MTPLLAALSGALMVAGALVGVQAWRKHPPRPVRPQRVRRQRGSRLSPRGRRLLLIGLAVGVVIATVTGWVAAVVVVPAVVVGLPYLLSAPPADAEVRRLEAMEEWVRSVSGVLTVGVGLEQAIVTSLRSTPEPIRPEVSRLVGRIRARWGTVAALRLFADELNDPTGDLIAANLILGAQRRGAGLATVLDALAESVGDDVRARREIEADRAKPRSNARLITLISVGVLGFLALSGDYVAPYRTPFGQALLVVLLAMYAGALLWMRKMSQGKPMPRFIGQDVREEAVAA